MKNIPVHRSLHGSGNIVRDRKLRVEWLGQVAYQVLKSNSKGLFNFHDQ